MVHAGAWGGAHMISLQLISEKKDWVLEQLSKRNGDFNQIINEIHDLDRDRRRTQGLLDLVLSELNDLNKSIGDYYKSGEKEKADGLKLDSARKKDESLELRDSLKKIEDEILEKFKSS